MANKNIKGITIEIGGNTQPLNNALKDVTKTASALSSELRVIDRLLKLDPSNVALLAQKQSVLSEAIEKTSSKLKTLKEAQQQAMAQLERGDIGAEQYRALEREVLQTENRLKSLKTELQNVDKALENVDKQSGETASGVSKLGNEAKKAENENKSFSAASVAAFAAVTTAIAGAIGSIVSFFNEAIEGSKEFRSDISKLNQNATAAGTSFEAISGNLEYFIALTDETDSSVEALSNLLKAGFTGETLSSAVNNLSGAVIAFPDTLKIESLADSLQETLATGEATGQYGELLERLGVNLDEFNSGLQKSTTSAEKQQYAIDFLAKNGMAELNAQYAEANSDLIAYSTAQTRYTETLSKVGTAMQPLATAITNIKTSLLEGLVPAFEKIGEAITEKLAAPAAQRAFKELGKAIGNLAEGFVNFVIVIIENGETILGIISSIAAGFAAWKLTTLFSSFISAIQKFATSFLEQGKNIITTIKNIDKASLSTIIGAIAAAVVALISFANSLRNSNEAVNRIADDTKDLVDSCKESAAAFADTQAEIDVTAEKAKEYADEIIKLDSKIKELEASEKDATVEKEMLAEAVAKLNATTGETTASINESTGALNENSKAIYSSIEAMTTAAKETAFLEYWKQLQDEQLQLEIQQRKNAKTIIEEVRYWDTWFGSATKALDAYNQSTEALAENEAMRAALEEMANEQGLSMDDLIAKYYAETGAVAENSESQTAILEEAAQKEQEIQQKRIEIITNSNNAILENESLTLQERIDNLNKNSQAVLDYENGLAELRQRAVSSGNAAATENMLQYLETLSDYSEESMSIVAQMVENFANGGGEMAWGLAEAYANNLALAKPGIESETYSVGADAEAAGGAGVKSNKSMQTEAESNMNQTVESLRSIVIDDGNFYFLGIGIINRLADGMKQAASNLYETAEKIVQNLKNKFNINISAEATASGANIRGFATGGIVWKKEIVQVAERGPEAIIPLDRLGSIINAGIRNRNSESNAFTLNVYTTDLSDGAQARLFKNFSKWAGRRLN